MTNTITAVVVTNLTGNVLGQKAEVTTFDAEVTRSQLRYDSTSAVMSVSVWGAAKPYWGHLVNIQMNGARCFSDESAATYEGYVLQGGTGLYVKYRVEVIFVPVNEHGIIL